MQIRWFEGIKAAAFPQKEDDRTRWLNLEIILSLVIFGIFVILAEVFKIISVPRGYYAIWLTLSFSSLLINNKVSNFWAFIIFQLNNLIVIMLVTILYGSAIYFYTFILLLIFATFELYQFKKLASTLFILICAVCFVVSGTHFIEGSKSLSDFSIRVFNYINLSLLVAFLLGYIQRLSNKYVKSISRLTAREKENETLFNETPIGLALVELEDSKSAKKVNKALSEILGLSIQETLDTNLLEIGTEYQPNGKLSSVNLSEILDEYRSHKSPIRFEWTVDTSGQEKILEIDLKPFPSVTEGIDLLMLRDVTESRMALQLLEETQYLVDMLFQVSTDGVEYLIKEIQSKKVNLYRSNDSLQKMLGLSSEELRAAHINEISPEFQLNGKPSAEYMAEIVTELKAKGSVKYEWRFQTKDGRVLDTEISAVNKYEDNVFSYLAIFRDITEQKKAQKKINSQVKELNLKNDELEKYIESNLQLENFAYIASHDLKSPIRTIVSFSQLLKKNLSNKVSDEENEYLDFIIAGSNSMQNLIDDLLKYARIEFTEKTIATFDPKALLGEILLANSTEIEDKKATISIGDLPSEIQADKTGLAQVFQNLILNGLKFVKNGTAPKIEISSDETEKHWIFSIKDNGIGIRKEYFERIFLIFKKLNNQEDYDGTGIGLSLCQKICQQHEGKIWLESEYGLGTTFYFSIGKEISSSLS